MHPCLVACRMQKFFNASSLTEPQQIIQQLAARNLTLDQALDLFHETYNFSRR